MKELQDMSINAKNERDCTGCGVCLWVCPIKCIDIKLDRDGFYKAYADESRCTNCGECQKVCYKFREQFPLAYNAPRKVYIGYNKDERIRIPSASGGFATALAETAIENGYKVIGAELDYETFKLHHVVLTKKEDLVRIRGSKYFQSQFFHGLSQIIKNQKYVVIGTPCQISALRKAINGKNGYENIVLIDLKCAGVLGRNAIDKFINYMKSMNSSGIKLINMRDKTSSWLNWGMKVYFKDGKEYYKDKYTDPLLYIFRTRKAMQDVCLDCEDYKKFSHADLRLEDAWAFVPEKVNQDYMKGLSQVTIYSQKGEELFNKARDKIIYREVEPPSDSYQRPKERDRRLLDLLRTDLDLPAVVRAYKKQLPLARRLSYRINHFMCSNFFRSFIKPYFRKITLFLPTPVKRMLSQFLKEW